MEAAADFFSIDPRRIAVVLIDFQNDFCSPEVFQNRPATNTHNAAAAARANEFALSAHELGAHVIYTQQVFDPRLLTARQRSTTLSGELCAVGTWGSELFVEPIPGAAVVTKDRFDCWQSAEFVRFLDAYRIDGLIIGGVELVCCVLYAVLGAAARVSLSRTGASGVGSGHRGRDRQPGRPGLASVQPAREPDRGRERDPRAVG